MSSSKGRGGKKIEHVFTAGILTVSINITTITESPAGQQNVCVCHTVDYIKDNNYYISSFDCNAIFMNLLFKNSNEKYIILLYITAVVWP